MEWFEGKLNYDHSCDSGFDVNGPESISRLTNDEQRANKIPNATVRTLKSEELWRAIVIKSSHRHFTICRRIKYSSSPAI